MTDLMHSRSCPSLWNADIPCDCDASAWAKLEAHLKKLEAVAEAALSVLSEEGVKEYLSSYVMGVELIERLAALEAK